MREKTEVLHVRVSPAELARIREKKDQVGIRNMGAYLRKMAMDGYCWTLDSKPIYEISYELGRIGNNLNQYAKRANETGSIYEADIRDLQVRMDQVIEMQKSLLSRLADLRANLK